MRVISVVLSCTWTLLGLAAQTPRLLVDVNRVARPAESEPEAFVQVGAHTFFTARTAADGRELWRTDGSAVGTLRLTDLGPGPSEVRMRDLRTTGTRLLFAVGDLNLAQELWVSDGTRAGTHGVRRFAGQIWIAPGARNGSLLVFTRDELWRSDGTVNGTQLVLAIRDLGTVVGNAAVLGNDWFFVRNGRVWQTDGTAVGTRSLGQSPSPFASPIVVGAHAYRIGEGGVRRSDGRSNDLVAATTAVIQDLAGVGGKIVFLPDYQLWSFDIANPQPSRVTLLVQPVGRLTPVGSQLFLVGQEPATGPELWVTDGTAAGTRLVYDSIPGSGGPAHDGLFAFGGGLLHAISTQTSSELWSVPAGAGTPRLVGRFGRKVLDSLAVVPPGGGAYFAADDGLNGHEVWTTDGTPTGTRLALDVVPGTVTVGSTPYRFLGAPTGAFFEANDGVHGRELWVTDGTAAGTRLVADVEPGLLSSDPQIIGWHAGVVSFVAGAIPRAHLWASDGTAAGTRLLLPLPNGFGALGRLRALDATRAILQLFPHLGASGVWVTDGQTATHLGEVIPTEPVRVGQRMFFTARTTSGQFELTVTDGTPTGTRMVIDLNGSAHSWAQPLAALHEEVLFSAVHNGSLGLYASDGTALGTRLVVDTSALGVSLQRALTVGDRVFLIGRSDVAHELWVTDGTAVGTRKLSDLQSSSIPTLQEVEGRVLVGTDRSVWRSDGTVAGTVLLRASESIVGDPVTDGRYAHWLSRSPSGILRTDGTSAGTSLLPTGPVNAMVALTNGRVLFTSDDLQHGAEPWVLDVGAAVSPLGLGCGPRALLPALRGTAPVLGSVARLEGDALPAFGVALLRLGVPSSQPVLLPVVGCLSWSDANGPSVHWALPFNAGRFAELLAIPPANNLVGARIVVDAILASGSGLEMTNAVDWTLGR